MHQDLRDSQMTALSTGYHVKANMAKAEDCNQGIAEALYEIAQAANTATTYKTTITTLMNTNSHLCKEITKVNTKLAAALEKIAKLQYSKAMRNRKYCWSCG